jgi:hypothetical protein
MKTPQVPHGVIDMRLGEEITTPLGVPRHTNPYEDESLPEGAQDHRFLETLSHFHGSELPPVRHFCVTPALGELMLSEGAHYFREFGGNGNGCHWLFDIFVTEVLPLFKKLPNEALLALNIVVDDGKAVLQAAGETPEADSILELPHPKDGPYVVWHRKIGFTDLCDMHFNLWMFRDGHVIIPSEY